MWTVVANIVEERLYGPSGNEIRKGTKQFRPRAKVYIIDWYAGVCEDIIVVGQARKSRRFIKIVIRATWVEDLRVKLCYNPQVIEKIKEHYPGVHIGQLNQELAQTMCKMIPVWQQEMNKGKSKLNNHSDTNGIDESKTNGNIFHKIWFWLKRKIR